MQWMPIILLLMIAVAVAASPAYAWDPFNISSEANDNNIIKEIVRDFIGAIFNGIKSLFQGFFNIIKGIFQSFADGIKDFAKTVFSAITKPFTYIADAFKSSLGWLQSHLGPLAPLAYILILAGAVVIVWAVIKFIVPGPIP